MNLIAQLIDEFPGAETDTVYGWYTKGQWEVWNYAQLRQRVEHFAASLLAEDLPKGSAVATLMDSRPDAVALQMAISRAGLVEVPLHLY